MTARFSDRDMLEILDLMEGKGLTASAVAVRFKVSRSSILGLRFRINRECDAVPDLCMRPENRDGGMPERWWDVPAQAARQHSDGLPA